jgi:hypothetical protein
MKEITRVLEVRKSFSRKGIDDKIEQTIIFEKKDDVWVYHAPNAQNHTIAQLETILEELKKMS